MKVIIVKNEEKKYGFEMVIVNDDGSEMIRDIVDIVDEGRTLKLPENPSNRKYFSIRKINEAGGKMELTYKESIKLDGTRSKKNLQEYLTPDEKIQLENLLNKAKIRKEEEENRPKSPKEKLLHKIERLQAKIKELDEFEE